MAELKVGDYFSTPPFALIAGRLRRDTGKEDFIEYGVHAELLEKVRQSFDKSVSFRLVFGSPGDGKTWTLSWLWRKISEEGVGGQKCLLIGIPKIGARSAERALVTSVIAGALESDPNLFSKAAKAKGASADLKSLDAFLKDDVTRDLLTGKDLAGRIAKLEGFRSVNLSHPNELLRLVADTVEAAGLCNYKGVLILIDELEHPFSLLARRAISVFSDFIREVYDSLEDNTGRHVPVQILAAGTLPVLIAFDGRPLGKPLDTNGLLYPFLRRTLTPFILRPPTPAEVENIAQERIKIHREKGKGPFIPYQKDAIQQSWKSSGGNLGLFIHTLQDMYDLARREGAAEVSLAHLKRVMTERGSTSE